MIMTNMTQSAPAATKSADADQPLQVAQAADAQGVAAQPGAAAQPDALAQPFAAWLGAQALAALPAEGAETSAPGQEAGAAAPAPATKDDGADDGASSAPLPQDGTLLAAMAMPLMPLTPVQVAQAVQAAQPSAVQPSAVQPADDARRDAGAPAAAAAAAVSVSVSVATASADGGRRAMQEQATALPQPAARPVQVQTDAAPAVRLAVHAQADAGAANTGAQDSRADHAGNGSASANAAPDRAAIVAALPPQPAAGAPAADTVKLAGPPTAWRQSLQEALGERLNVQVGKNVEQAVIRLEPPQLGRIDIAIRHSAGTLEVNISASNGEVLRQLQTVSDNLRSDLSQRQFTEVAVTVTPAPKNGAAPFGDPQQGRGRQQGREQEEQQPGRALAEADNNASAFSLGGRG